MNRTLLSQGTAGRLSRRAPPQGAQRTQCTAECGTAHLLVLLQGGGVHGQGGVVLRNGRVLRQQLLLVGGKLCGVHLGLQRSQVRGIQRCLQARQLLRLHRGGAGAHACT